MEIHCAGSGFTAERELCKFVVRSLVQDALLTISHSSQLRCQVGELNVDDVLWQ